MDKTINISHSLLMSYLLGEANSLQIDEVENWLSISEENNTYLQELEDLWLRTGKLSPVPVAVDSKVAWTKITGIIDFEAEKKIHIKPKKYISYKIILRIAAVLLILFGISMLFIPNKKSNKVLIAGSEILLSDTLPDGSVINLNKHSKIIYPESFSENQRLVKLQGEAFFNIKRNKKSPFIIETEGGYVEVLGTSFNINAKPENKTIEVFVKTGKVKLYTIDKDKKDTSFLILSAGQKGIIDKQKDRLFESEDKGTNSNDIFWLERKLIFEDAKLEELTKTIKNIFNVNIYIKNNKTKTRLYTGTFENDSIEQIIFVISETFPEITLKKEDKNYFFIEND